MFQPRRGAAAARAAALAGQAPGAAGASADLARRRIIRAADFAAMGWPVPEGATVADSWLLAAGLIEDLASRVPSLVAGYGISTRLSPARRWRWPGAPSSSRLPSW